MRRIIGIILIHSLFRVVSGQFYSTGQAPASVKWKQIRTSDFQVIFPEEFQKEANRTANLLTWLYEKGADDYRVKPKKVSVILHNRSVLSNGYVSWAPRRSEWVTTPARHTCPQDWLEQLAIHEFRHILQVSNLDQGLTGLMKILLGEAAAGMTVGYLPVWFLEGDAVAFETASSLNGRGRESDFDREIRAIELDRGCRFTYDQSYLGSYRHYTPDYYQYGYQMASFARLKYGEETWDNTLRTVSLFPFTGVPFYLGLRKNGIRSKTGLYQEAFDSLKNLWNNVLDTSISINTLNIYTKPSKDYTHYRYVQPVSGGYFAVRSGIDDIPRFVLLTDSAEKLLFTPGYYLNTRVDAGSKYLCWEEYQPDLRWEQQSFNQLLLYDLTDSKLIRLGKGQRWFSPALSPSEDKLVCIQIDLENTFSLLIIEVPGGRVLQEIVIPEVRQISSPVWTGEETIAFISLENSGELIRSVDIISLDQEILFKAGRVNLDQLEWTGEMLLFTFDLEAARNIYGLDKNDKQIYRLTSSRHGADFPSWDPVKHDLIGSEYTLSGYKPFRITADSLSFTPLEKVNRYEYSWAEALTKRSRINIITDSIGETEYEISPYRKLPHLFNLHSWAPFYVDPYGIDNFSTAVYPGVTLMSQNKLSTLTALLSYFYKGGTHYLESRFIYEGLYPVFDLELMISSKESYYRLESDSLRPGQPESDRIVRLHAYLPMTLSRNKWRSYLRPEISFGYLHRYYHSQDEMMLGYGYLEGKIIAYNYLKRSPRDIQPRFGQSLYLSGSFPLKSPDFFTPVMALSFQQYLPGIGKHHSIKLGFSFEKQDRDRNPMYYNKISLPRGYDQMTLHHELTKFTADYILPLGYPDLSIGPLAYIKRLSLTAYYDAAWFRLREDPEEDPVNRLERAGSLGLIFGGDIHFLRFFMPFKPSLRISWLPGQKSFDLGFGMELDTSL